jgi:hypothetical protein
MEYFPKRARQLFGAQDLTKEAALSELDKLIALAVQPAMKTVPGKRWAWRIPPGLSSSSRRRRRISPPRSRTRRTRRIPWRTPGKAEKKRRGVAKKINTLSLFLRAWASPLSPKFQKSFIFNRIQADPKSGTALA